MSRPDNQLRKPFVIGEYKPMGETKTNTIQKNVSDADPDDVAHFRFFDNRQKYLPQTRKYLFPTPARASIVRVPHVSIGQSSLSDSRNYSFNENRAQLSR